MFGFNGAGGGGHQQHSVGSRIYSVRFRDRLLSLK